MKFLAALLSVLILFLSLSAGANDFCLPDDECETEQSETKIIHPTVLTVALHLAYAIHAPDLHLLPLYILKQSSWNLTQKS